MTRKENTKSETFETKGLYIFPCDTIRYDTILYDTIRYDFIHIYTSKHMHVVESRFQQLDNVWQTSSQIVKHKLQIVVYTIVQVTSQERLFLFLFVIRIALINYGRCALSRGVVLNPEKSKNGLQVQFLKTQLRHEKKEQYKTIRKPKTRRNFTRWIVKNTLPKGCDKAKEHWR